MEKRNAVVEEKLKLLPDAPGVYLMKDALGEIIYVGKAEVLKKRVRSYFQSSKNHGPKVKLLVNRIVDLETIVTANELEALILECNLIKKYRPKYNISLKDDKSYPFIKITLGEDYPRIFPTRYVTADGSKYFGPYANAGAMHDVLRIIRRLFPLRTCKTLEKRRPCLQYHIGNCPAPCANLISKEEYRERINSIILLLEGRNEKLIQKMKRQMEKAAEALRFEEASLWRDRLQSLEIIMERQHAYLNNQDDRDVIGIAQGREGVCIQVFFLRSGKISGRDHFLLDSGIEEDVGQILSGFLKEYYGESRQIPMGVLLPQDFSEKVLIEVWLSERKGSKVTLEVPQRGTKRELVDLANRNAENLLSQAEVRVRSSRSIADVALEDLAQWLELPEIPERMECYDISHTQGAETVASMVVFTDGVPDKSQYRRYKLRTVEGKPDDFASMEEVLQRRSKNEKLPRPDLIIIDGGKGQLSSALDIIRTSPLADVQVISLAKQFEWVYRGDEKEPVVIPHTAPALKLLQRIRDEAHRFAISYHRGLRTKRNLVSILDHISGIGPKRRQNLRSHFGTIEKIREASLEELSSAPGMNKAAALAVWNFFRKTDKVIKK